MRNFLNDCFRSFSKGFLKGFLGFDTLENYQYQRPFMLETFKRAIKFQTQPGLVLPANSIVEIGGQSRKFNYGPS